MVCESPGHALVCVLVGTGIGMTVGPEMVATMAPTPLSVRREPAAFRRTISVVHHGDRASAATATLCALLRGGFGRAAEQ